MVESEKETVPLAVRKLVADTVTRWRKKSKADSSSVLPGEFSGAPTYYPSGRTVPEMAGRDGEWRPRKGVLVRVKYDNRGHEYFVVHRSSGAEWEMWRELTLAVVENDPASVGGFVYEGVTRRLAGIREAERRRGFTGEGARGRLLSAFGPEGLPDPTHAYFRNDADLTGGLGRGAVTAALRGYAPSDLADSGALHAAVERLPESAGRPLRSMMRELIAGGWDALRPKSTPLLRPFAAAHGYTDRSARAWYSEAVGRLRDDLVRIGPNAIGESRWPVSEAPRDRQWARRLDPRDATAPLEMRRLPEEEFVNLDRGPGYWVGTWYVWTRAEITAARIEGWEPTDPPKPDPALRSVARGAPAWRYGGIRQAEDARGRRQLSDGDIDTREARGVLQF